MNDRGNGIIRYKDGAKSISKGDSLLIAATLGEYEVSGKLEILVTNPTD